MRPGTRVGILGLARSGRAAAELALARGATVYASDAGAGEPQREAAEAVRRLGGEAEIGAHDVDRLADCELLVVSPGIPPTAAVLREPRLAPVPKVSELEFAYRFLDAPIIAVTGTNGKTTTTALAAHLLRAAGFDAPAAGNIGVALSEIALRDPAPDWVAVEASSFQLGGTERFAPRIGVVTNLSPDHLDRYTSVEAYYADKARLFDNASPESVWILNGEDDGTVELAGGAEGRRYFFRVRGRLSPGELGAFAAADGELFLRTEAGEASLGSALPLLGEHNRANALAAALAAVLAGAPVDAVRDGLRTAPPLEHRLEVVTERDGVLWINDSKATNLASTRVALRSMERPTVLLLGGRHKGEAYTGLLPELRERVRVVIAYGEAAALVEADLAGHVQVEHEAGGFEAAIARAAVLARAGETVLLSPACASYDEFRDYEARGRRFRELASSGGRVEA